MTESKTIRGILYIPNVLNKAGMATGIVTGLEKLLIATFSDKVSKKETELMLKLMFNCH